MRTTKLDAVNTLLDAIGEDPVDSLDTGLYQAQTAERYLDRTAKKVLSGDWHFNRENKVRLSPNAAGEIEVPANAIEVDASSWHVHTQQRGNRLYDLSRHTFKFSAPVEVDMTVMLEWEDLPEPARQYITARAAREYQKTRLGSDSLDKFLTEEEASTLQALSRYDSSTADYNMFHPEDGDPDILYITQRY